MISERIRAAVLGPLEPVAPYLWWVDSKQHWHADGKVERPSHVPQSAVPLYAAPISAQPPSSDAVDAAAQDKHQYLNDVAALAEKFTDANDRGDAASADYEYAETDEERAYAARASDAADADYNHSKAALFLIVRMRKAKLALPDLPPTVEERAIEREVNR